MLRHVALATYEGAPNLSPDDQALTPQLARLGLTVRAPVWSDVTVDWGPCDAVIVRSCWDYHLRIGEFRAWLERLETLGLVVLNSPALMRWNADKRYLLDLARRGVTTIPTVVVSSGCGDDVARVAVAEGWEHIVIK